MYIKVTVVWSHSEFRPILHKFSFLLLSGWDTKSLLKSLAGKNLTGKFTLLDNLSADRCWNSRVVGV